MSFLVAVIVCLLAVVWAYAGNKKVSPSLWVGANPQDAAMNLLKVAWEQAGKKTSNQMSVARVYYLSGNKEEVKTLMSDVREKGAEPAEMMTMGRVLYEAGEWDKARSVFEEVLRVAPKEAVWLAEIGAYYNLQGDRDKAEELFSRSFDRDPDNLQSTVVAAGSYVGVTPR
jgi:tetratricopeptide (TPR) repeat protein